MILVMGPPGAGKSVQAELLDKEGKVKWLSAGKILREHADETVKDEMAEGDMVDDRIVENYIAGIINTAPPKPRILLDGFPRRASQVHWLLDYLKTSPRSINKVIHLHLPLEESVERLIKRGRPDDKPEVIKKRYVQYIEEVLPIIDAFKSRGIKVVEIDGTQSIEDVHKQLSDKID